MVSIVDGSFLLKPLKNKGRSPRSDDRPGLIMRSSAHARRWRLKSEIDSKSAQPSFRWTKTSARS